MRIIGGISQEVLLSGILVVTSVGSLEKPKHSRQLGFDEDNDDTFNKLQTRSKYGVFHCIHDVVYLGIV